MAGSSVELATGYISLAVSTKGLGSQVAREFTGVEKQADKSGKRAGSLLGGGIGAGLKAGAAGAAAIGAVGVLAGLKDTISAAGELEQSVGGVQAVFKDYAKNITDSSKQAATAVGLSENAYNTLAATIGSTLKNKGVKDFGKQTENLIGLGADLASQFGGSTQEAVDALSSALRGESDPIERYGVSLNAAAIDAEAFAIGIAKPEKNLEKIKIAQLKAVTAQHTYNDAIKKYGKNSDEALTAEARLLGAQDRLGKAMDGQTPKLNDQQKAMAALSIINKQTADAQGNFARETDTLAGKQAQAAAQFDNLKAAIGNAFLPAASAAMGFIARTMLPALSKLVAVVGPGISGAFSTVKTAVAPAVQALGMFRNTLRTGFTEDEGTPFERLALIFRSKLIPAIGGIIGAGRQLASVVLPIVRQVAAAFLEQWPKIQPLVVGIFRTIGGIVTDVMALIKGQISTVTKVVTFIWSRWGTQITKIAGTTFKTVIGILSGAFKIIGGLVKIVTGLMTGNFSKAGSGVKLVMAGMAKILKSIFAGVRSNIATVTEGIRAKISEKFNAVRDKITSTIRSARDTVRTILGAGAGGLQGIFSSAVGAIGRIWDGLKAKTKAPIKFVIDTVINGGLIKAFNAVAAILPGIKAIPQISIPGFDGGGWTGPGSRMQPAGIVHADEYVISKPSRQKIERQSPGYLDYLNKFGQLPGYFLGGGVLPTGGRRVQHSRAQYPWARYAGDLQAGYGTPVRAYREGTVAQIKRLGYSYGHHIRINHPGGERTLYAHLSKILVNVGQKIARGQTIGNVGATGKAFGPHLHFELAGGSDPVTDTGGGADAGGGGFDILGKLRDKFAGPMAKLAGLGDTPLAQMAKGLATKVKDGLLAKGKDLVGDVVGTVTKVAGTAKASAWTPVLLQAMKMTGMPLGTLDNWIRQVASESGGNPNITQQVTDVNSRSGNRAQGLLQVIPPTFAAYRSKSLPNNPFNPLSNAYAAMNYALKRYGKGSIEGVIGHGHGYAAGTKYATRGMHQVAERGPELVINRQSRFFGGGETVLNASQTRSALAGGGVHIGQVNGMNPEDVAREVVKHIRRQERLNPTRA